MITLLDIKSILKKKKEIVLFDLYLKNYDDTNFYFSILYHEKINKYKVLFVPIDTIENKSQLEDYFCYQFIFSDTVDYILNLIEDHVDFIKNSTNNIENMDSHLIQISMRNKKDILTLSFIQAIDKKYYFLFPIITIIFEHSPNIVSELCHKLLLDFYSDKEMIHIKKSLNTTMNQESIEKFFKKEIKDSNQKNQVSYLEKVGNRYYAIVKNHIIIIEEYKDKKIVNIYAEEINPLGEEVYSVFQDIFLGKEKKFIHICIDQSNQDAYYFCYGIKEDKFLVFDEEGKEELSIYDSLNHSIHIKNSDKNFIKKYRKVLEDKYIDEKVEEYINKIID